MLLKKPADGKSRQQKDIRVRRQGWRGLPAKLSPQGFAVRRIPPHDEACDPV